MNTYKDLIEYYIKTARGQKLEPIAQGILDKHTAYNTLKASHTKLVEVIEAALRISDLWTLKDVETMFENEAKTLELMKANFEQALKEAEKISEVTK